MRMSWTTRDRISFWIFVASMIVLAAEVCTPQPSLIVTCGATFAVVCSFIYHYGHEDDFLDDRLEIDHNNFWKDLEEWRKNV